MSEVLWILATLICYFIGVKCYRLCRNHPLSHPLVIAVALLLIGITVSPFEVSTYLDGNRWIDWLLGPVTVILAVPLYHQLAIILKNKTLVLPLVVGGVAAPLISFAIACWVINDKALLNTLLTKSITTPFAVQLSEKIGGIAPLAAVFVIVSGIMGAVVANSVFRALKVKSDIAKGIALGVSSHAIGTAHAAQLNAKIAGFSTLGLILNGILTALSLPLLMEIL